MFEVLQELLKLFGLLKQIATEVMSCAAEQQRICGIIRKTVYRLVAWCARYSAKEMRALSRGVGPLAPDKGDSRS